MWIVIPSLSICHEIPQCGTIGIMTNRLMVRRPMTGPELLLGFVILIVFIFGLAFLFALLGIDPPSKVGPLPWMVE